MTRYYYGPERQRIRRMDYYSASAVGSADVADEIGNAEIITRLGSSTRELRRSLGPVILSRMINGGGVVVGSNARFLFTDAQGSPHRITAADGTLVGNEGSRWFSAFGARAETTDGDVLSLVAVLNAATDQITRQSYTGHEAADAVGLIHMDGRMYDPIAGRFLQPDPFVQDPSNPQNFNRYTYVFNNPLAWTDPTGHWGAREQGALRTVAAIVIAVWTGVYVNPGTAALTSSQVALVVVSGAAVGALQTGTLRGALVGAFTAGVGTGIGQAFARGTFGYVAAHAILGGVTSTLNGGKFGHGFVSAGFSSALSPAINTGNDFSDGFLHAMVGGTASRLSGGKFANGAVTAAFSFAVGRAARGGSVETGSTAASGLDDVIVPAKIGIASVECYATVEATAKAAGGSYGPTGVTNRQELEIGLIEHDSGGWGYLTPGWGPVGSTRVDASALYAAYEAAGYFNPVWMHGHFDNQLNFSAPDFGLIWGKPGATYLVNSKLEVRALTNAHLQNAFSKLPASVQMRGLNGLQRQYIDTGLPGTILP